MLAARFYPRHGKESCSLLSVGGHGQGEGETRLFYPDCGMVLDHAIIMYMTTVPVAEARAQFSQLVDAASSTHERIEVTKNGRRAVVILGAEDYDALLETLDVLADADLVARLDRAEGEMAAGEWYDEADVREAMRQAGRL